MAYSINSFCHSWPSIILLRDVYIRLNADLVWEAARELSGARTKLFFPKCSWTQLGRMLMGVVKVQHQLPGKQRESGVPHMFVRCELFTARFVRLAWFRLPGLRVAPFERKCALPPLPLLRSLWWLAAELAAPPLPALILVTPCFRDLFDRSNRWPLVRPCFGAVANIISRWRWACCRCSRWDTPAWRRSSPCRETQPTSGTCASWLTLITVGQSYLSFISVLTWVTVGG